MPVRRLTKSRFQLAMSCPAKLYYDGKPAYANRSVEDAFLNALAEGGFQVGALARAYYPGGILVGGAGTEEALGETLEMMAREEVTLFEAAFEFGPLLARTDILIKRGGRLQLIEVKAKSFHPGLDSLHNKNGSLKAAWMPYLYDAAFQKLVLSRALPGLEIETFLMLADKSVPCPVDGLNQMFRIKKDARGQPEVLVSPNLSPAHLNPRLLVPLRVDAEIAQLEALERLWHKEPVSFPDYVDKLADHLVRDEKIISPIGKVCASCPFHATKEELAAGLRCGYRECWRAALGFTEEDFEEQTVLDLWNFYPKDQLIESGTVKLRDMKISDAMPASDKPVPGLSTAQRQWLQADKARRDDPAPYMDAEGLRAEMTGWTYPLHFIDFETSMAAIPFNKGRRPYEGVAFQFSHHIAEKDGAVRHAGEYLNTLAGAFPNYDFLRELKRQLQTDSGTIFRYADHENSFLNIIYRQLLEDTNPIPDRDELLAFIRDISKSSSSSPEQWVGPRNMVDLLDLVKRYYYHPATRGSNSIKQVLPAILSHSAFLRRKYARPVYGAPGGIPSLNFTDWAWIRRDAEGKVMDPYQLLPAMFTDLSGHDSQLLSQEDEIRDGGAALTAYARLQFEEMSLYERGHINRALKQYCELDTLAMVMLYEAWAEMAGG